MKLEKILKDYDCDGHFTIEKASIQTALDRDLLCNLVLDVSHQDLPILITQGKAVVKIPNRDIPQFIKALALMCDEAYF